MIKISVIIPVYNVEQYLKKCLNSIINQTLKDIEIICIDDGSTDSSLKILEEFKNKDERITLLTQNNEGAGVSRNKGIHLCQGEYISFVDSDDWLELDALEKLYNNAISNDADIVLFNAIECRNSDMTKNRIYLPIDSNINYNNFAFSYHYNKRLVMNGKFTIWSKIYRNSFLKDNSLKFYNHKIFNDVQFHIETMLKAKKISYLPEILYYYNKLNENSLQTRNLTSNERLIIFEIFKGVKRFLINNHYFHTFKINYLCFVISQSKVNFEKTLPEFKEEYYNKMRIYFINLNVVGEDLKQISSEYYKFYILVLNNKDYAAFEKFNLESTKIRNDYINKKELGTCIDKFDDMGINLDERKQKIIISLTSFPERMEDVHFCIYSLLRQKLKPDKIILWLAESQFPNKEKDLPKNLLNLKRNGLTIEWCEDIKSYKKLIPALKAFPNDYIITSDDDIFYPEDWLENLWKAHEESPNHIIASRCRRIKFDEEKTFEEYSNWSIIEESNTSFLNFITCGAGSLYPPNSLHSKVFDEESFKKLCPQADDIWFWAMAILNRTKIKCISTFNRLIYVNIARDMGILGSKRLWDKNQDGYNDIQFNNVINEFPVIKEIITNEED